MIQFRLSTLKKRLKYARDKLTGVLSALLCLIKNEDKVFAIGFNKTATSSIHQIFLAAGFRASHSRKWRGKRRSATYLFHNAFSDGAPIEGDFKRFEQWQPNCKFILNIRDLDEWLDSRLAHIEMQNSHGAISKTNTWQISEYAIKTSIQYRNLYHLSVLDYFKDRPDKLLVINYIADPNAGQKISDFIGKKPVTEKIFQRPIPKTREHGVLRFETMITKCLNELGIPEAEWKNDLYCPSLVTEPHLLTLPAHIGG